MANHFRAQNRTAQKIGYLAGIAIAGFCVAMLFLPGQEHLHASGPMNIGHEDLSCAACHKPADGSRRQQIQANLRYLIGMRAKAVDYGMQPVNNGVCMSCHERSGDKHPVFRFFEPRFAAARKAVKPQFCSSCHLEHTGTRVSLDTITYCSNCHENTALKNDPISVPHATLIARGQWQTCLGCHDFHGNHIMETATAVEAVLTPAQIDAYFKGAVSPYSERRYHRAKTEEELKNGS